jgi:hypothetical protein
VLPPEATVLGEHPAVTLKLCATGSTVSAVESLSPNGLGPSQVAFTVRVTIRSESPVFAGAVYVGFCTLADGLKLPPAPPSSQLHAATPWPRLSV